MDSTTISTGDMQRRLAALGIHTESPLGRNALGGSEVQFLDGVFRVDTPTLTRATADEAASSARGPDFGERVADELEQLMGKGRKPLQASSTQQPYPQSPQRSADGDAVADELDRLLGRAVPQKA